MANVVSNLSPAFILNSTANGGNGTATYLLGNGSNADVSAIAVHIVNTSSLGASITVKARSQQPQASTDGVGFVGTVYRKLWLNGLAGDGSLVTTAITDTSLIIIPASGLQIALDVTYTSGTGKVYWTPVLGPSVI